MLAERHAAPAPPPDPVAFAAIYAAELAFVWRSVRRLGVPARDLPDVTHDVFVTVFRNLWKYDATRELRPWLFGVLMRVVSDHMRLARHRHEALDTPPDVADRAPRPDERAETSERWHLVDRALATIDLPHRAVLVMHDFEGHRGPTIARTLGIHPKTVYSRLRTARRRFLAAAPSVHADESSHPSPADALQRLIEPIDGALDRGVRRAGRSAGA
jgi:RNA polymerase sigma-70 factor, ECF subfamily